MLLDTCAISELKRPKPDAGVLATLDGIASEDLFLSVLSAGEIAKGIALLEAGKRKAELEAWLRELGAQFAGRLLPVDLETAHIWGEITARLKADGQTLPAVDGLIAATALRHGLHLMTRNAGDVEGTGALILNPWNSGKS